MDSLQRTKPDLIKPTSVYASHYYILLFMQQTPSFKNNVHELKGIKLLVINQDLSTVLSTTDLLRVKQHANVNNVQPSW